MKIAVFTNNYIPIISGVTQSIESFREGLEKRGHKVFVFAPRFPGHKDDNPNVFRFSSVDFRHKTAFPIAIARSRKIYKQLKKLNVDIIHSQHPFNTGKAALRYARKLNIPIVFTNHTRYDLYTHFIPIFPQRLLKWYVKTASINYANKCDRVISPTQSIKEMLIEWGMRTKIEVIPTGIKPEQFVEAGGRDEIRQKFSIKNDDILVMTVSRLAEEKNVDFLIKVFSKLKEAKSNKKIKFMVIGDGSDREKIEEKVKELKIDKETIFTGAVPHDDIAPYFKAGDIFVYSSLSETQGIMISEAMASGLPIVAVKAPGAQDIINSGIDGILSPEIEEAFVQRVLSLIENDALRKKISENAVKNSYEYSQDACVDKMFNLYQEALRNRETYHSSFI